MKKLPASIKKAGTWAAVGGILAAGMLMPSKQAKAQQTEHTQRGKPK